MRGEIYMSPIERFREYRDAEGELRGDPYESLVARYQSARVTVKVAEHEIREL